MYYGGEMQVKDDKEEEIFTIKACRCKRCGGILLSDYGLKHKMGHVCKAKYDLENSSIDENQITFDDILSEETEVLH